MSHAEGEGTVGEAARVAAFLRALSARAERDPQFAASLVSCFEESGLLSLVGAGRAATEKRLARQTRGRASVGSGEARPAPLDPFTLWRAQGEDALRRALEGLDLQELRAVVRAHRLDPARVSSRWTAHERVVTLIVEQVKARLNHGRAFERV